MKYDLIRNNKISIGKSELGGRGIFALEDIQEEEILEEAHFILCSAEKTARDKELSRYFFSIFYNEEFSPEENEEFNFKTSLALHIADEELQKEILKDLKELKYQDISKIFSTAAVLGYGMIYNHSFENFNATWEIDFKDFLFRYKSIRSIQQGEEILINYGNPEREDLK